MELNRNPENYYADVEQAAFSPANMVPGIGHSPDKMLQFRIISYADAHRYRLGVNYEQLPVNRPKAPVNTYHRDGSMRFDGNYGGEVNYEPNSLGGPGEDSRFKEPHLPLSGPADRYDHRSGNDDFTQAGNLYRLMGQDERARLHTAIAGSMKGIPREIIELQMKHFARADAAYADGVRKALAG
jgi:catalase